MVCLASAVFHVLPILLRAVGTELLSLRASSAAFLRSAHWSPTFRRAFHWGSRTCSSSVPWRHPHSYELLPFLMHFLSFVMLSYKKADDRAAASQKLFLSHYLFCVILLNAEWLRRTAEVGQAEDHCGQQNGKLSWLLHGYSSLSKHLPMTVLQRVWR